MQICRIPLTLQFDLLFWDARRRDNAEESTRFFHVESSVMQIARRRQRLSLRRASRWQSVLSRFSSVFSL